MIYLLHGDNQTASREQLVKLINGAKETGREIIRINGLKADLTQIIQALESQSLFGREKAIIIENLFSRPQSTEKKEIIDYLKKEKIEPDLIFWERKSISGTTLRWLPKKWQVKIFKTPAIIFKFLDSIGSQNKKQTLLFLREVCRQESPEMAFYMLARRIKELILAKDIGRKRLKGAPWQIGRLLQQAKNFSLKQLIKIYRELLQIDVDLKTGQSLMPLDWQLDLLIINL